jgi:acyl-coenzyme A synthetase/AMP-(fatty) acid ligase
MRRNGIKCFIGEWYLSGDLAKKDDDGYFWFIGHADDSIKTSRTPQIVRSDRQIFNHFLIETAVVEVTFDELNLKLNV